MCTGIETVVGVIIDTVVSFAEAAAAAAPELGVAGLLFEGGSLIAACAGDQPLSHLLGIAGAAFGVTAGVAGALANVAEGLGYESIHALAFAPATDAVQAVGTDLGGEVTFAELTQSYHAIAGFGTLGLMMSGNPGAAEVFGLLSGAAGGSLTLAGGDVGALRALSAGVELTSDVAGFGGMLAGGRFGQIVGLASGLTEYGLDKAADIGAVHAAADAGLGPHATAVQVSAAATSDVTAGRDASVAVAASPDYLPPPPQTDLRLAMNELPSDPSPQQAPAVRDAGGGLGTAASATPDTTTTLGAGVLDMEEIDQTGDEGAASTVGAGVAEMDRLDQGAARSSDALGPDWPSLQAPTPAVKVTLGPPVLTPVGSPYDDFPMAVPPPDGPAAGAAPVSPTTEGLAGALRGAVERQIAARPPLPDTSSEVEPPASLGRGILEGALEAAQGMAWGTLRSSPVGEGLAEFEDFAHHGISIVPRQLRESHDTSRRLVRAGEIGGVTGFLAETLSRTPAGPIASGVRDLRVAISMGDEEGKGKALGELGAVAVGIAASLGADVIGEAGSGGNAAEGAPGLRTAEEAGIAPHDARRIQAVADKTGGRVTVVGSRAAGSATPWSDWDYIVEGNAKARSYARWQLPKGLSGGEFDSRGAGTGIDIFREPLDPARPHVHFDPTPKR